VCTAFRLYSGILDLIERVDHDVLRPPGGGSPPASGLAVRCRVARATVAVGRTGDTDAHGRCTFRCGVPRAAVGTPATHLRDADPAVIGAA